MAQSKLPIFAALIFGAALLLPALFTAQTFLGAHAGFGLLSLLPKQSGMVALILMSVCGALIAALPFGLLFGVSVPQHSATQVLLFAAVPALFLLGFSVWVSPEAKFYPLWFVRLLDTLLFVSLFFAFARLGACLAGRRDISIRRWPAITFAVLATAYHFSPQVYYSYFYVV